LPGCNSTLCTGVLGIFAALTGGAIENFSIVMLGLSPYINASIILQLGTVIFPKLESISKEGVQGQQQINRYTRWITPPLAILQSYGYLLLINQGTSGRIVDTTFPAVLMPMIIVTCGCMFAMWVGELITEKGIGNGISLLIFAGIVSSMPQTISSMLLAGGAKLSAFYFFIIVSVLMLIAVVTSSCAVAAEFASVDATARAAAYCGSASRSWARLYPCAWASRATFSKMTAAWSAFPP
jgi:preprotein translocase subunit SecY